MFFYRVSEEAKQSEDDEAVPQTDFGLTTPEYGVVAGGDQWTTTQIPDFAWPGEAQEPISAAGLLLGLMLVRFRHLMDETRPCHLLPPPLLPPLVGNKHFLFLVEIQRVFLTLLSLTLF